jgi:hypothetical protein
MSIDCEYWLSVLIVGAGFTRDQRDINRGHRP